MIAAPAAAPTEALVALIRDGDPDDAEAVRARLRQGADPNGFVAGDPTTPLREAVTWDRLRIAKALLENGGRVEFTRPRARRACPPSASSARNRSRPRSGPPRSPSRSPTASAGR